TPTPAAAAPHAAEAALPTAKLTQAFDASLTAMAAGTPRDSARAILGAAGGDADVADLLDLAETLFDLPDTPGPRPVFRYALRDALANAPEPRSLRRTARPPLVLRFGQRLWQSTKIMAAAAAAIILFVGAGVTFASANALPGDWLYPVKRTTERAQLWLDGPSDAIHLHLTFADRRLGEAVARPPLAGMTLAEFNREVTAALATADDLIARRVPRAQVADPLLAWLLGARGNLVAGRAVLPPMAWRGTRALLDEAILALDGGRPLAEMQVPRLADPAAILAMRVDTAQPWARYALRAGPLPVPPIVADVPLSGGDRATTGGRSNRRATTAGVAEALARTVSAASAPQAPATTALVAIAPRGGSTAGGEPPKPTSAPAKPSPTSPRRPAPTSAPTNAPPAPTSTEPDPIAPSPTASVAPPATSTSTVPTSTVPTTTVPTSTVPTSTVPTTVPTALPTAAPSATAQPVLAADLLLACDANNSIEVYQTTRCTLALTPGWSMPDGWDIAWTTTSVNPADDPELVQVGDNRSPQADFTPKIALTGVSKMLVTLRAAVRDPQGQEQAVGKIILFVVPHNHGQVTPEAAP
ncbi:MAG: DUF5667 domain-containing protein, partial [Ardenticatenales bacterium]